MFLKGKIVTAFMLGEDALSSIVERFEKRYGATIDFDVEINASIVGGVIVTVEGDVYDGSVRGRLAFALDDEARSGVYHIGSVVSVGDGIATIRGLEGCRNGELITFESGAFGIALNIIDDKHVSAVLLTSSEAEPVAQGHTARRTQRVLEAPVGEALLGRVIDPLGHPLDGKSPIRALKYRRVEAEAPGIMDRAPVDTPLQTGVMAVDGVVPIGRGQRELIIGDRQTGKTAIALDTILNQKGMGIYCVYVGIGQKNSTIAALVRTLEDAGAMEYTTVVNASASDSAPMQYIAPFTGCAVAEEFMYQGKDVLIVYDDLSKHAVAYRSMSLLLKRPPGREAYPGDIFYLHSRLLERAAKLSPEKGGGSMTALPIIETLAGDISAYIPTNVISITDGQIFLSTELFHSGMRPALNIGLSVSRVGGSAQTKAMRKVAGKLRLELAQYRELMVFSQFGSELDSATRKQLQHGERLTETLKQDQYKPLPAAHQVIVLVGAVRGHLDDIPLSDIRRFNAGFLQFMIERQAQIVGEIQSSGELPDEILERIEESCVQYKAQFLKGEI